MEYTPGQVVYSKSGHDKGLPFIVISVEGEYVYIVDGKRRRLEKPKRKKIKHIQKTNYVDEAIRTLILENGYMLDADIVKTLKKYCQVCL